MRFLLAFLFIFLVSCARSPVKTPNEAMRKVDGPVLQDNLSAAPFIEGIRKHREVMAKSPQVKDPMRFGEKEISKAEYLKGLEEFEKKLAQTGFTPEFYQWVRDHYDFWEVYGKDDWSEVLVTGYYETHVNGATKKTEKFSQPIYKTPSDLVAVDMQAFWDRYPDLAEAYKGSIEQKSREKVLRGRLDGKRVVPYYDRSEIDSGKKISDKKLELAWLDPIDAFFLQIQGSGEITLENGKKLRVGYASQNGYPYTAIGKFLTKEIPIEEMSMQRIEQYLRTLPREKIQEILNKNLSYVFFQKLVGASLTYAGMDTLAGRTIATDTFFFPKGALAFLDIEEPVLNNEINTKAATWERKQRFVLDQDTGGAIRGTGRVDLYFGEGSEAALQAGGMKRLGRLFYLSPKITR